MRWIGLAVVAGVLSTNSPTAFEQPVFTSLQAIARAPDAYANRAIRTIGRFRGRAAGHSGPGQIKPLKGRWDFLLNWDEEAVWVSGLRPVGRDFDLDPSSPADARSGPWLEVVGVVRVERLMRQHACISIGTCGRVWIDATDMRLTAPPTGLTMQLALRPAIAAPVVVFHDPLDGEENVARSTRIRLQFSRHMAGETLSERVRVSYATPRPLSGSGVPRFTAMYLEDRRGLEITFASPLAAGAAVRVDLLDGIRARDGRKLEPFVMTFTTGDGQ
jgi:hypothetical protein